MPTRNISLTAELDAFVEQVVKAGEYQNASEAVRDALRALQQRRREDALSFEHCAFILKLERTHSMEVNSSRSTKPILSIS